MEIKNFLIFKIWILTKSTGTIFGSVPALKRRPWRNDTNIYPLYYEATMINIEIKLRPLINQKWFSEMYCVTHRVECSLIYIFLMNVTRLCRWQHFNVLCVSETNYNLILPHATALSILPLAFNVRTPQQTTVFYVSLVSYIMFTRGVFWSRSSP